MSWTYVGGNNKFGGNQTFTLPATAEAGDLLVYAGSSATSVVLPAGWTEVPITSIYGGLALWWKSAEGGETNVTVSGGSGSSPATRATVLMYRGFLMSPLDSTSTEKVVTSASSLLTNSLTTTEPNELVIAVAADNASSFASGSMSFSGSGATSAISRYSNNYDSNFSRAIRVVEMLRETPGAIQASFLSQGATNMVGISVSFKANQALDGAIFFGAGL